MVHPTKAEIEQIIKDHPKECWYYLAQRTGRFSRESDDATDLVDKARVKCGYHCRENKCPYSGERTISKMLV